MNAQGYTGADDLAVIQSAMARWIQEAGQCGYCHVGDLPHAIYNGLRGRVPPERMVSLWRDGETLVAFSLLSRRGGFDAYVSPVHRGGEVERIVLDGSAQSAAAFIRENGLETPVTTGVFDCDLVRQRLLGEKGFVRNDEPPMLVNVRTLDGDLPTVSLPEGFTIRAVQGDADAAQLAAVHSSAFGSNWTAELYRDQVMHQPGYSPEREWVVVAPDGRFAAFTVTWRDDRNRIGYFEPVGTHADFQRRGLGRALLAHGFQMMRSWGMHTAHVNSEVDNVASNALYRAVGFAPAHTIRWYQRVPD